MKKKKIVKNQPLYFDVLFTPAKSGPNYYKVFCSQCLLFIPNSRLKDSNRKLLAIRRVRPDLPT